MSARHIVAALVAALALALSPASVFSFRGDLPPGPPPPPPPCTRCDFPVPPPPPPIYGPVTDPCRGGRGCGHDPNVPPPPPVTPPVCEASGRHC